MNNQIFGGARPSLTDLWRLTPDEKPSAPEALAADRGRLFTEIVTRRIVLTGPPSSGKTTNTDFLDAAGFDTKAEAARLVLSVATRHGYRTAEIFDPAHLEARQSKIFFRGLAQELEIDPDRPIVMDRSFLDAIPFSAALGMDTSSWLGYAKLFRYQQVVYLEPLPLVGDAERPVDPEFAALCRRVDELSRDFWNSLGYRPIYIPALDSSGSVLSIPKRLGLVARALGFSPESAAALRFP